MTFAETIQAPRPEKMKNVIVWYSHNASADYISGDKLPNGICSIAGNYCSTESFREKPEDTKEHSGFATVRDSLQTSDGIQYWHFKHKSPLYDTPWDEGVQQPDDLRYWINKLDETLQSEGKGETIDAIVVPIGLSLTESPSCINFINELKERYPNIKVIVHQPRLTLANETEQARRFAWAEQDSGSVDNGIQKVIAKRQADGSVKGDNGEAYRFQPGVDMITLNHTFNGSMRQNALRDLLGMERLQEHGRAM